MLVLLNEEFFRQLQEDCFTEGKQLLRHIKFRLIGFDPQGIVKKENMINNAYHNKSSFE